MTVTAMLGTAKGGFIARSNPDRSAWTIDEPLFKGWKVTTSARDDKGRYFVATASDVYGPALHVSDDLKQWKQIEKGPSWAKDLDRKLNQIWTLHLGPGRYYAGVDEAGLFASDDGGESWSPIEALNEHATRSAWAPGAGGLCAHALLVDPKNTDRVWCGISAVGVFRTEDGGRSWHPKNQGIPQVLEDKDHKDVGYCVHGLIADPDDANTIYRREHNGMFRSRDGGDSWERIENGLPNWFGFPIAMDRRTRTIFVHPMESDEYRMPADGKFRMYRSRDGGDSWEPLTDGLPQQGAYMGVLRSALDCDQLDPCGVYVGTTAGTVYASNNAGDSWTQFPCTLPRVLSVTVFHDG